MRVIVGALAQGLREAEGGLLSAEQRVVDLLVELFPGWSDGWKWRPPDGIEIYEVIDSRAARAALHLAGFLRVTCHDHNAKAFLTCDCEEHRP
jgi:hypothetical protein